jgi:AcrR family transcriptional regulator
MGRSRSAILDGARRAVATNGTRLTMAQIASGGGVAKATLYNHFRTRDDVLAALVLDELEAMAESLREEDLADALSSAANGLAQHPLLRVLAEREPATLAALGRIDMATPGWQLAHTAVEAVLSRSGRAGTEFVLRWLASFILSPATSAEIAADLAILLAGLADVPSSSATAQDASHHVEHMRTA